jgi:glycerol-3-phosphate cytidylyltransferase-like family protein
MAEVWLAEAQQWVASLKGEMADLHICHEEAVTNAKDAGEKLLGLVKHAHKDQEEAQKVKDERDELSRATGQF